MEGREETAGLVADSNILISALIKDHSINARLIKSGYFIVYFPEYGMKEIDEKDAPFLALAMQMGCPVWSNDKHFQRQKAAKVYTTRDILGLINYNEVFPEADEA